nr:chitinase [Acetatifactor sp.]
MKKKAITVIVALFLIAIVAVLAFGKTFLDRYTYSKERADLNEYYGVSGEELAVILQDEMVEEKALFHEGNCYLDLDTVHRYLNEVFYADMTAGKLLYTTAVDTYEAAFGQQSFQYSGGNQETGYTICFEQGGTLYLALDYV